MRQARYRAGAPTDGNLEPLIADNDGSVSGADEKASKPVALERDFFGRIICNSSAFVGDGSQSDGVTQQLGLSLRSSEDREVWVSFHEGFSNAVRKPITLEELMKGF